MSTNRQTAEKVKETMNSSKFSMFAFLVSMIVVVVLTTSAFAGGKKEKKPQQAEQATSQSRSSDPEPPKQNRPCNWIIQSASGKVEGNKVEVEKGGGVNIFAYCDERGTINVPQDLGATSSWTDPDEVLPVAQRHRGYHLIEFLAQETRSVTVSHGSDRHTFQVVVVDPPVTAAGLAPLYDTNKRLSTNYDTLNSRVETVERTGPRARNFLLDGSFLVMADQSKTYGMEFNLSWVPKPSTTPHFEWAVITAGMSYGHIMAQSDYFLKLPNPEVRQRNYWFGSLAGIAIPVGEYVEFYGKGGLVVKTYTMDDEMIAQAPDGTLYGNDGATQSSLNLKFQGGLRFIIQNQVYLMVGVHPDYSITGMPFASGDSLNRKVHHWLWPIAFGLGGRW